MEGIGKELVEVANKLWDANQTGVRLAAQTAADVCELPPELMGSPAAARFLAKLQRLSFTLGVAAALWTLMEKEPVPANGADAANAASPEANKG